MALPRENRLSLRLERDRLNKEGKTYFSRHLTIISAPFTLRSSKSEVGRFAILLSKKTAKLATDRNLIKRRTSALIFDNLSQFPIADYLLIPKRSVLDTPHSNLLADFLSLLQKLK